MGYKLIKETPQQKKYCDYIENKFAIAKQYNTIYELSDEDMRIQKLYEDNRLQPVDNIKMISRVKAQEDGEEYLTITKNVDFINKITKTYHDRYSDVEGITELPLKITNEEGVEESSQLQLVYTIPFSKQKAKEYLKKPTAKTAQLRFYIGPVTANRAPIDPVVVGNTQTFTDATWEELLLGREKKIISSRINRIDEIRKEMKESGGPTETEEVEDTTHEELNKEAQSNKNVSENGDIQSQEGGTPPTRVRVKIPATANKNN